MKTGTAAGINLMRNFCMSCCYALVLVGVAVILMSASRKSEPCRPSFKSGGILYKNLHKDSLNSLIQLTIKQQEKQLYFPLTVARFYHHNGNRLVWVLPESEKTHGWEALLLLDCVLQFGLSHDDYHPLELLTIRMHEMLKNYDQIPQQEKALFDVFLTDGIIAFMNHLHYGKLNPYVQFADMDQQLTDFIADVALVKALGSSDFMTAILSVQPQSAAYQLLQSHLRLVTGQYIGDCYEVPAADVRKMAVNLERLRWISMEEQRYVHINIPNFMLRLKLPDTSYQFRAIVGRKTYPTPILKSEIVYFTTAPEWRVPNRIVLKEILPKALHDPAYLKNNHFAVYNRKGRFLGSATQYLADIKKNPSNYYVTQSSGCDNALGQLVFRFPNSFAVYLHDTPDKQLFSKDKRAFSHGCIRVEHAQKLAKLLLVADGRTDQISLMQRALTKNMKIDFRLKKAMPIIITYLTCEVIDGVVEMYDDLYELDQNLEHALYLSNYSVDR